jgi:hypothetical protein
MASDDLGDVKFLLRKMLFTEGADLINNHLWIFEGDRWKELVFALLTKIVDLPESEVRGLVGVMDDLDLLEIQTLSNIVENDTGPNFDSRDARHISELLQENGFSQDDAQKAIITMGEAARGLKKNYNSKVQLYLRKYGEEMIKDLGKTYSFSLLDDAEVKLAFTYWLQNVLNMPLSLEDDDVNNFCKDNNLTPERLFAAADEENISFALVDDIIRRHVETTKADKSS